MMDETKEGKIMVNRKEALIDAWLKETSVLINHRMVEGLSFNEAFVCNLLNRRRNDGKDAEVTATWLCSETGMLKSQMNKTLNALERKGLILRERSSEDRRKVYIHLREENMEIYHKAHSEVLEFVDKLMEQVGEEKIEEAIAILNLMADTIRKLEKGENGWQYKS